MTEEKLQLYRQIIEDEISKLKAEISSLSELDKLYRLIVP